MIVALAFIVALLYASTIKHIISDGIWGVLLAAVILATLWSVSYALLRFRKSGLSAAISVLGLFLILAYAGIVAGLLIEQSLIRFVGDRVIPAVH
jgi:hypothetical protein